MLRSEFNYTLPEHLIAQYPLAERSQSRLLCLDGKDDEPRDSIFSDLPSFLRAGDLLVFNDTRVIPARLSGQKESGGKVEVLVERLIDNHHLLAQLRASRSPRMGSRILLDSGVRLVVQGRRDDFFELCLESDGDVSGATVGEMLNRIGHMPLPPYINRDDESHDRERYQTVYARNEGAVAAPTAGLHFDQALMERLQAMGVNSAYVTLHVGAGTFQPVRCEQISEHRMHSEFIEVSAQVCQQVLETHKKGGRVIAVGTTSVRCLESAAQGGKLAAYSGETDIFITPGYRFQCIDALVTNFHFPESTLLMLVCAFGGMQRMLMAYDYAVKNEYRFFSYGDAMFIAPSGSDLL